MQQNGFIGPSYTLRSVNVDCQRSVNLYLEQDEAATGKNSEVASLVGTPGLRLVCTLGTGPVRGLHLASNGRVFAASGSQLYEIVAGAGVARGAIASSSRGPVSMADNGKQLCLVDGPNGYILTFADNAWAPIVQDAFQGANRVAFQDGYFIFNQPGTRNFFISDLYDGSSIDGLDFAAKEGQPDNLISLLSDHREVWLFGEQSTEVWFNSGDPDFPFSRIQGAFLEHGIDGAFTAQKLDSTIFWVSKDRNGSRMVMRAAGYQPGRCSTHAVESALSSYGDFASATSYTYQSGGHSFYVLNHPEGSWAFDTATNLWHERAYTGAHGLERHRADCHTFAGGKHLVGDYENGNLYELTDDELTDNGAPITAMRIAPHLSSDLNQVYYNRAQLDMQTGDGYGSSDPQVMLQFSDDSGRSWSNEKWASAGRAGKRKSRVQWRRLGRSRDRVFKIVITDPIPRRLISFYLDAAAGAS